MGRSLVETVMGGVVLLIAAFFVVFAYSTADIRAVEGYEVRARFFNVEGLGVGSDVRVGGVKVGSVISQDLDQETYEAVIVMTIKPQIELPTDTRVSITTDGLLGENYVRLRPGQAEEIVQPGGELVRTKDVVSLEQLLGKAIFLLTEDGGSR